MQVEVRGTEAARGGGSPRQRWCGVGATLAVARRPDLVAGMSDPAIAAERCHIEV